MKKICVPFNDKLNGLDKENQTYGCRHTNPDICSTNMMLNICSFSREDYICKKPSRSWKKQYIKLLNESRE
ncbi:MAG: hypothetical protein ACRC68_03320 [Clostridium sp.]